MSPTAPASDAAPTPSGSSEGGSALRAFSPAARSWFAQAFASPTPAQEGAWRAAASGEHALVIAPTGSGKTLAAFLWAVDRLLTGPAPPAEHRLRVLYVSPLKALAADVERNLSSPLVGIGAAAAREGTAVHDVRVGVRTGDTPASQRRAMVAHPPDVLITTPESLYLMLTSQARSILCSVETVIVDEVHAVAGTKRGAHLALSLERLDALLERPAQRIGLSATVRPAATVADFLVGHRALEEGGRPVRIVSPGGGPRLEVSLVAPVEDFTDPAATATRAQERERAQAEATWVGAQQDGDHQDDAPTSITPSVWPALTDRVVDLIAEHRSTIVFTASRRTAERLTARINAEWQARLDPGTDTQVRADGRGVERGNPDVPGGMPAQIMAQSDALPASAQVLARAHHGSMSREERTRTEEDLKAGRLRAVVATSSLELGIDMGAVDLVIQVGAPTSVASALQRIGRAGHQVGATSRSVWLPTHRGELLSALVVAEQAAQGRIEEITLPGHPLDVLAQQVVAMLAGGEMTVEEISTLVRRAAPYRDLGEAALTGVLDMLAGRYPSEDFADLLPRVVWDRSTDTLSARPGAQRLAVTSGGTIPDRGMYGVFLAQGGGGAAGGAGGAQGASDAAVTGQTRGAGRRVGELDEEMVFESRVGDLFTLGTSTWRIEAITPDRVLVSPAPGAPSRLPFWRGDGLGRPAELGAHLGRRLRQVAEEGAPPEDRTWDTARVQVSEALRENLTLYVREQEEATGHVPDDRTLVLETFRDELGDWRLVLHCTLGARVLAPWALVIGARLRERTGMNVQVACADDGIVWRLPDAAGFDAAGFDGAGFDGAGLDTAALDGGLAGFGGVSAQQFEADRDAGDVQGAGTLPKDAELPGAGSLDLRLRAGEGPPMRVEELLVDPSEVSREVVGALAGSAHLASRFREAAARSLLLPKRNPAKRQPLWQQRHRAAQLFAVASRHEDFPVLLEAVRESLREDYDVPALADLMRRLGDGSVRLVEVTTAHPSPFARSLLMGYTASFLYDEDAPAAERRASALALSPALLAELVGAELGDLADLLDADAVAKVAAQVGLLTETSQARTVEDLADLIRRLGPLTAEDLARRVDAEHAAELQEWVAQLEASRRIMRVRVAGTEQLAVVEDAARLRDALGTALPTGLPQAVLAPVEHPLVDLIRRHARTHGPFTLPDLAERLGLAVGALAPAVDALVRSDTLVRGRLTPGSTTDQELVDAEVLRRMRRASLAALRHEVEAVPAPALASHLARWQGVAPHGSRPAQRGEAGLVAALDQLAGVRLPSQVWEDLALPTRVADYSPALLDRLTSSGEIVWVGAGRLPGGDGQVALVPREVLAELAPAPGELELGDLHRSILDQLSGGGALFFSDLVPARTVDPLTGHPDPGASPAEVAEALWDLAWAGLVTNDSLAPLRAQRHSSPAARSGRSTSARVNTRSTVRSSSLRRSALAAAAGARRDQVSTPPTVSGRWSLVPRTQDAPAEQTLAARSVQVLELSGVLVRGLAGVEEVPGGFGGAYQVMRRLEETGQVRRGYLVEGLGGAQFALPEVVDRLRTEANELTARRDGTGTSRVHVLAATDPAQPYGAALDWPATPESAPRPARAAGAVVVLVDSVPALYLGRGGTSLTTFPGGPQPAQGTAVELALAALMDSAREGRVRSGSRAGLLIDKVDGAAALQAPRPVQEALKAAGFLPSPQGYRLRGL